MRLVNLATNNLPKLFKFNKFPKFTKKDLKIMKKIIYTAPEVMAYEVAAERGYQVSGGNGGYELPGLPAEKDETSW